MTEHAATPTHDLHAEPGHHGHDNSPEAVRKEVRKYLTVFAALAGLTVITVAVSYLDLKPWQAIALALVVASVKAGLVAAVFMHLMSEKKLIYAVLAITVFFFAVLMWGPWHHRYDAMGQSNVSAPPPEPVTGQSQGH